MNHNSINDLDSFLSKDVLVNEDIERSKYVRIYKNVILCDYKMKSILYDEFKKLCLEEKKRKIPSLSAAIVVKDEERCILRCIESILEEVDEIIIVDTGSIDNTVQLIESINSEKIKLYFVNWIDDFSYIRNYALSKVSSEWVFFIDADEYLSPGHVAIRDYAKVFQSFRDIEKMVFSPKIVDSNGNESVGVGRFFKKGNVKYYGLVHEELRLSESNGTNLPFMIGLDIPINHDGYISKIMEQKNKVQRNKKLLEKMLLIEPDNLRWVYFYLRDLEEELPLELIERYVKKYLLLDGNKSLCKENIKENEYSFAILSIYASKHLIYGKNVEKTKDILHMMDDIWPENRDTIYWKIILEINLIKQNMYDMLKTLLDFRKNNLEPQYGAIHSDGKNIDLLIGYLLFQNGFIQKAMEYFKFVEDIGSDNSLILECKQRIHSIIENCYSNI